MACARERRPAGSSDRGPAHCRIAVSGPCLRSGVRSDFRRARSQCARRERDDPSCHSSASSGGRSRGFRPCSCSCGSCGSCGCAHPRRWPWSSLRGEPVATVAFEATGARGRWHGHTKFHARIRWIRAVLAWWPSLRGRKLPFHPLPKVCVAQVPGSTPFLLEVAPGSKKWQARSKINAVRGRRMGKEFRNYLFIKRFGDFRSREKKSIFSL
jgi:hypothetical protein